MKQSIYLSLLILALGVVGLGAYTRLKDAGLGCPDWPGCYGYLLYPTTPEAITNANNSYPNTPFVEEKAWPEMYHRYVAGILGLGAIAIAIHQIRHKVRTRSAYALILCVGAQALLGAWTVTMLLHPIVVMSHLLGGFTITSLIFYQLLRQHHQPARLSQLTLALIIAQIIMGGWTSANYAALVCPNLLTCANQFFPPLNVSAAFFDGWSIGTNYEYGILDYSARVTIHMLHRYLALITSFMLIFTLIKQRRTYKLSESILPISVLCLQLALGIANIKWLLPIHIAVAHNLVALCLLLSWIRYSQLQPISQRLSTPSVH